MPRDGTSYCLDLESSFTHLTKIYRPIRGKKAIIVQSNEAAHWQATVLWTSDRKNRRAGCLDQVTRVLHSAPCSPTTVLEQTGQEKPCFHTFCHSRKSQPSVRQHDPLESQWEEQGAYGSGAQSYKPTGDGNSDSFSPKGVKHIVMARRRYLSLLNTLTVNSE